jgi:hypothetical protein
MSLKGPTYAGIRVGTHPPLLPLRNVHAEDGKEAHLMPLLHTILHTWQTE